MTNQVKIRFGFTNSNGETETETMWTLKCAGGYRINNIPFYATELAFGDVIRAEPDEGGVLWYTDLISPSGHSTIRLWFSDEQQVSSARARLKQLGCGSEVSDLPRLLAVDVPASVDYGTAVKAFLDEGERDGVFEYEEACLGSAAQNGGT